MQSSLPDGCLLLAIAKVFLSLSGFHTKRETPACLLLWMDSLMWLSGARAKYGYHGYRWGGDSSLDGFKSPTGCCKQLWCLFTGQNHSPSGEGRCCTHYTSPVSFLGPWGRMTFGWWELNVALWFDEKNPHSLMRLNTWPLNDGTVWESYEMSKRWSLLEEVPGGGSSCSLSFSAFYVQTKDDHPASLAQAGCMLFLTCLPCHGGAASTPGLWTEVNSFPSMLPFIRAVYQSTGK